MTTPRVAHVTTAHPATDNRILRKECAALAAAGVEVHLVAVAPADGDVDGVRLTALPGRSGRWRRMLVGPFDAWRALRRLSPDLIHVHDPELIPLALAWRLRHRRPAVYDAHEDLVKQVAGKTYLPRAVRPWVAGAARVLEWLADRGLSAVVAATPAIRGRYRNARTTMVQNFPWLSAFPPPEPVGPRTRDLVYVGAISAGRGLSEMLATAERLPAGCRLTLAGPVADADAETLHRGPANVSYRGVVPVSELGDLVGQARIGLALLHPLPNYLESQSTKVYEYMAAARPFVASGFPAWRRQLEPFGCGVFVDPADPAAVDAAVQGLLADDERAREMGRRGRAAFERHFTFDTEAEALVRLTLELARESS